jgi:hypothetical protein
MIQISKLRELLDELEPIEDELNATSTWSIQEGGELWLSPRVPWQSVPSVYLAAIRQIRMLFGGKWKRKGSLYSTSWTRVDPFGGVSIRISVPTEYLIPKKPLAIERSVTMAADDEDDVS